MPSNQLETLIVPVETPLVEAAHSSWRDFLGIIASIGCAIHCAVMPMVIGYLPLLGLEFLANEAFHKWMVLVCLVIALAAFLPGWRQHRRLLPTSFGSLGLCLIAVAAFLVDDSCSCCPTGEESLAATPAVEVPAVEVTAPQVCTEACCSHDKPAFGMVAVDGEVAATNSELPKTSTSSLTFLPLSAGFASWLTPFGGLLLVVGHLLNRRATCRCKCCAADPPDSDGDEAA